MCSVRAPALRVGLVPTNVHVLVREHRRELGEQTRQHTVHLYRHHPRSVLTGAESGGVVGPRVQPRSSWAFEKPRTKRPSKNKRTLQEDKTRRHGADLLRADVEAELVHAPGLGERSRRGGVGRCQLRLGEQQRRGVRWERHLRDHAQAARPGVAHPASTSESVALGVQGQLQTKTTSSEPNRRCRTANRHGCPTTRVVSKQRSAMEQWRSQVPELLQAVPLILAPLPTPAAEMQLRVLLRSNPPALFKNANFSVKS